MDNEILQNQAISSMAPDVDSSGWPNLRLKSLTLKNFGRHEFLDIDLSTYKSPLNMACLLGPNGTGKTTILHAIQILFSNHKGYTPERFRAAMGKYIRNPDQLALHALETDFSVKGTFVISGKGFKTEEYEVEVTSREVVSEHPDCIKGKFSHYCYFANFDMQLSQFALKRKNWDAFQSFFSELTGYKVQEMDNEFDQSYDVEYAEMLKEFVLGFYVDKPNETITQRQCSAGEKKIIKCFSTILNRPVQPAIILIDNVTDHIESGRHLALMDSIQACFPDSQLILTCHSTPVQKNFPQRDKILDMRTKYSSDIVSTDPWRLRLSDEVKDISDALQCCPETNEMTKKNLLRQCDVCLDSINSPETKSTEACILVSNLMKLSAWTICHSKTISFPSRLSDREKRIDE